MKKRLTLLMGATTLAAIMTVTGCVTPAATTNSRGLSALDAGDLDKAEERFQEARDMDPSFTVALLNLGLIARMRGDHEKAIDYYTQAIEEDEDYEIAYNNRGAVYMYQGKDDLAMADFNKATEVKESYIPPYLNRARIYDKNGEQDKAMAELDAALEQKEDAEAYYLRGLLHQKAGDTEAAKADYRKAIKKDKEYEPPRVKLQELGETVD